MNWIQRLPFALRLVVRAVLAYCAIFVIGLLSSIVYYSTTDNFETYLAEHQVPAADIEERLFDGRELAVEDTFFIGSVDPLAIPEGSAYEYRGRKVQISVERGDESVLEFEFHLAVAFDPKTATHGGVSIPSPSILTRSGLRSIVSVGLVDMEEMVGPNSMAKGTVVMDVLIVSGTGKSELRFRELGQVPQFRQSAPLSVSGALPMFAGFVFPFGSAPENGWMKQYRLQIPLNWKVYPGGGSGAAIQQVLCYENDSEYSSATRIVHKVIENESETFVATNSWRRIFTWNGNVW